MTSSLVDQTNCCDHPSFHMIMIKPPVCQNWWWQAEKCLRMTNLQLVISLHVSFFLLHLFLYWSVSSCIKSLIFYLKMSHISFCLSVSPSTSSCLLKCAVVVIGIPTRTDEGQTLMINSGNRVLNTVEPLLRTWYPDIPPLQRHSGNIIVMTGHAGVKYLIQSNM